MKLYEEYKLYEELWEDITPNDTTIDSDENYYKIFGRKKYNLSNDEELRQYIEMSTNFQLNQQGVNKDCTEKHRNGTRLLLIATLLHNLEEQHAPEIVINNVHNLNKELRLKQDNILAAEEHNFNVKLEADLKQKLIRTVSKFFEYTAPSIVNEPIIDKAIADAAAQAMTFYKEYRKSN